MTNWYRELHARPSFRAEAERQRRQHDALVAQWKPSRPGPNFAAIGRAFAGHLERIGVHVDPRDAAERAEDLYWR